MSVLVMISEVGPEARAQAMLSGASIVGRPMVLRPAGAAGDPGDIEVDQRWSSACLGQMAQALEASTASHLLWIQDPGVRLASRGLHRLRQVAADSGAAMLYCDSVDVGADGTQQAHPRIDLQPGALRDDFDFGPLLLIRREALLAAQRAAVEDASTWNYAAWYELWLRMSQQAAILRVPEPLYQCVEPDPGSAHERHFAYVDPKMREVQIEMEQVWTAHLKRLGAWLSPRQEQHGADDRGIDVEASVVIPVRDRKRTIAEAVRSALQQEADFSFNVIVVDNHSSDGTTELLAELAAQDGRLIHCIPQTLDLGIGGCWNDALFSPDCGRYVVQLDSDDLYAGSDVVARVVAKMQSEKLAVLVGAYTLVDFDLHEIEPGLIDHREWTDANGHNNALRIHGLGAPRAFHAPTLRREGGFANVSYGEDYGVMLRLCRRYRVGRILDSLYWCRRWEGNSDAALPVEVANRYHFYKDHLRSLELAARQRLHRGGA